MCRGTPPLRLDRLSGFAMTIRINPADFRAQHLSALNRAFPGWGDERRLQWCFGRSSSEPPADVVVVEVGGIAVAGTGISYRRLVTPHGRSMLVGIFTAAWSFPVKAERGIYMRMMAAAVKLIAERGGALALGFMPQDKTSGHQLLRAGAMAVSTAYMLTSGTGSGPESSALKPCAMTELVRSELFRRVNLRADGCLKFAYSGIDEFAAQFLERPNPVQVLADPMGNYFIVERTSTAMSLLSVLLADDGAPQYRQSLAEASSLAAQQRLRFLLYASNGRAISAAAGAGFVARPGFVTATIACRESLTVALSDNGTDMARDEMALSTACLAALQSLHVENGDRM
jgi:hypothetical protein